MLLTLIRMKRDTQVLRFCNIYNNIYKEKLYENLLTMILAMGFGVGSINAQELEIATEETLTELSQERATKHGRTWLRGLDLTTEQWA